MPEPYTVIVDDEGCMHCGRGKSYTVQGPDQVCIGTSFEGEDGEADAEATARDLNEAFMQGERAAAGG